MKRRWMIWVVLAAIVVLAVDLCVPARGQFTAAGGEYEVVAGRAIPSSQCGPGGCVRPRPGWQPQPIQAPVPQNPSAQEQPVYNAVARISNRMGNVDNGGSAVLVDVDDTRGLLVTNYHMVRDGVGTVTVNFPTGESYPAKVGYTNRDLDLCALVIRRPRIQPLRVAAQSPRIGDWVFVVGYPHGRYTVRRGRLRAYMHMDRAQHYPVLQGRMGRSGEPVRDPSRGNSFEISAPSGPGASGGLVLNTTGELVGVIWGGGEGSTDAVPCTFVDKFCMAAGRYLLPWNAKINDPARDPRLKAKVPAPQQPPQVVAQPPGDASTQAQIDLLDRRMGILEARQDKVRDTAEALAKKYEDKLPGITADVQKAIQESAGAKGLADRAATEAVKAQDGVAAVAEDAKATKSKLQEILEKGGPLKQKLQEFNQERLGMTPGVAAAVAGLGIGLVAVVVIMLFVVLIRKGEKAAMAGEPTLAQRLAERTPWTWDDKTADVEARVLARLGQRLHPGWSQPPPQQPPASPGD